jgi:hypothetical protein
MPTDERPVITGVPANVTFCNSAPVAVIEPVMVPPLIVEELIVELVTVAEVNVPPVNVALVAVNAPVTVPLE